MSFHYGNTVLPLEYTPSHLDCQDDREKKVHLQQVPFLTFFVVLVLIETIFTHPWGLSAHQKLMLTLANELLNVSIIDPDQESHLLGPRYCSGCSVRQVSTASGTPLLAGPEYPTQPSAINGQGAPEVFQHTLFDHPAATPEARLIIGAGLVENSARKEHRESHWNSRLTEPCQWSISRDHGSLLMETTQQYQSWSLELRRELRLRANSLQSLTLLRNIGRTELPFRWFAHPFFPFHEGLRLYIKNLRSTFPPNPAFALAGDGTVGLEKSYPWSEGYFLDLAEHAGISFEARISSPGQPRVDVRASFPLLKLALWANDRTCSPEPFFGGRIAPGNSEQWSITYTFEGTDRS